jgi:hypothetical protein
MALNSTHTFEELEGVKCSIVEKGVTPERAAFLRELLEMNGYTVQVVKSPPPKAKPAAPLKEGEVAPPLPPPEPETFIVGVTDVTFSPMNAIFNRELKTKDKTIVTAAYWRQEEDAPQKDEWYWFHKK